VDLTNNEGCTTLYLAAQEGYVEIVRWLLNHGTSCHVARTEVWTVIPAAAENGKVEIFTELLKQLPSVVFDSYGNCKITEFHN
jgi:ankyrin repeat protein